MKSGRHLSLRLNRFRSKPGLDMAVLVGTSVGCVFQQLMLVKGLIESVISIITSGGAPGMVKHRIYRG